MNDDLGIHLEDEEKKNPPGTQPKRPRRPRAPQTGNGNYRSGKGWTYPRDRDGNGKIDGISLADSSNAYMLRSAA